jgi:PAS domain S-box-containing protein
MQPTYSPSVVVLSVLMAIFASFTALDLAGRVSAANARARLVWLGCGSLAMGVGIWSMHFVGMLAFHLPTPIAYDIPLWLLSVLVAILASQIALFIVSRPAIGAASALGGGLMMGIAISGMHYIGMAAMRIEGHIAYDPTLVVVSVLIAIAASFAALWLARHFGRNEGNRRLALKFGSAVVMGFAISGMHYTAMAAARFAPLVGVEHATRGHLVATTGLTASVAAGALLVLCLTLLGAMIDRRMRHRSAHAEALERSEARFRSLVEATSKIVWHSNARGEFDTEQPAWTAFTGCGFHELMGFGWLACIHPDDQAGLTAAMKASRDSATSCETECRLRRADGAYRSVRIHAVPVLERDGNIREWIGTCTDVTEQRTRERQLRRAEHLASVGTLVSGVAHELNNPLAAISGFTQLLRTEELPQEAQQTLSVIQREAERAAKIVADLRHVARQTPSGDPAKRAAVDLNTVVTQVLKVRDYSLKTHNVEVRLLLAPNLPRVLGDQAELEQVLLNLIVNAEQALAAQVGNRRITVRTSSDAVNIKMTVEDTGPGIPAEHLHRVFDPFWTTKDPGVGTGLGLSLVQSIIAEHSGQILADSAPERGARFRIQLPRAQEAPTTPAPSSSKPKTAVRALRILVVDDEPALRSVLSRYLRRRGHEVDEAEEGFAALQRVTQASKHAAYDIILSDLRMPGLGGDQLLEKLRDLGTGMDKRVIILTGDAACSNAARVLAASDVPVLLKPFDLREVAELVEAGR